MPSPAAHALGGLATAFVVDAVRRKPLLTPALVVTAAAAGMAPDLDLLFGSHRTYTHSLGAVLIVGVMSWVVTAGRGRLRDATRTAAILAAAYGSHLALDWMSKDTATPSGVMMVWPWSSAYYVSGWNVFGEVSRRYWRPEEFIFGNLRALTWELAVMTPLLLIAWVWWSRSTLHFHRQCDSVSTTKTQ
ncbi:MAG TPA: metal-dependent hydrolase [Vicinamibacterales bacterium]|nr:metal-dependent hydrolase [Vicinamibacterales bacterium]